MCVQYWPAGRDREEEYSGVGVTVENEEQLANFMIRTIRLRKVSSEYAFTIRTHIFKHPKANVCVVYTVGRPVIHKVLKIRIWGVPLACLGSR